jgi:hypothetical protein
MHVDQTISKIGAVLNGIQMIGYAAYPIYHFIAHHEIHFAKSVAVSIHQSCVGHRNNHESSESIVHRFSGNQWNLRYSFGVISVVTCVMLLILYPMCDSVSSI